MNRKLWRSWFAFMLAVNASSAMFDLSSSIGDGTKHAPTEAIDKSSDVQGNAAEHTIFTTLLKQAGNQKMAHDMKTLHVVSKLASGELQVDTDMIKHLAGAAQLHGYDVTDEHVDLAASAVEYATTGKGNIKDISTNASKALTDFASKNGHISEETANDIRGGISALEERNVGELAKSAGKMFAKSLISKDLLEQGLSFKKAAQSGDYVGAISSGVKILGEAASSKYAPPMIRAPAAIFQIVGQVQSEGLSGVDLNTVQKIVPIPLPDGTLSMLGKGAIGLAQGKGVGQIMQKEGANFLANKAGGVPFFGGMLSEMVRSNLAAAGATETDITRATLLPAASQQNYNLLAEFSKEELAVMHRIIAEYAAQKHIPLPAAPIAPEASGEEEAEMKAVSSPKATARVRKQAAKRRRVHPLKPAEPETVDTDAEPPAEKATMSRRAMLNAKRSEAETETGTQFERAATNPVHRGQISPVKTNEPEVSERTSRTAQPRKHIAPKPTAHVSEQADSSATVPEENAILSRRQRRKRARIAAAAAVAAAAVPVADEPYVIEETTTVKNARYTNNGKHKRII